MADPRTGLFLPTTPLFDVGDLNNPQQAKELIIRLTQKLNDVILALNLKTSGYFVEDQFVTGDVFFSNPALSATTPQTPIFRQVFRKVIDFGALPDTATKSVAHGLVPTALWTFTLIYATASDTTGLTYIPIPYASPVLADNIALDVDAVNVNITTGSNRTNYNICYIVLEFIKN